MERLCTPAIIYVLFSVVQIILDLNSGLINTAVVKFIIMVIITILLNILCQRDLAIISWIIVFIPFIMMTFMVSLILYIFGLSKTTGKEKKSDTSTSQSAEYTAQSVPIIPNVYSPSAPYNPQPSISPPQMGYPPANTYTPPPSKKSSQQTQDSQDSQQSQQSKQYNYLNISKFYPYPSSAL